MCQMRVDHKRTLEQRQASRINSVRFNATNEERTDTTSACAGGLAHVSQQNQSKHTDRYTHVTSLHTGYKKIGACLELTMLGQKKHQKAYLDAYLGQQLKCARDRDEKREANSTCRPDEGDEKTEGWNRVTKRPT